VARPGHRLGRALLRAVFFRFRFHMRAAAIRQVEGFVLDYYYEEVELSLRLWDADWSVIHDPSLSIVHHHEWQGRDWTALNRKILRNTILAAMLRYPAWLVPAAVSQYARNHIRRSRAGFDEPNAVRATRRRPRRLARLDLCSGRRARKLPYVVRHRRPVRWETIQHWRGLREQPTPL